MFLPYLFLGVLAGAVAAVSALVGGRSIGYSLLMYSGVGTAGMTVVPLVHVAVQEALAFLRRASAVPGSVHADSPATAGRLAGNGESERNARSTIRILAVDDDPFILGLVPIISANAGFSEVTPVSSGQLALQVLEADHEAYDCFLLDISMPEIDGIELCRRIRGIEKYNQTPIIMLTAMRDMKSMDFAFQAGATDYVTKPFDVIELSARLRLVHEAAPSRTTGASVQSLLQKSDPASRDAQGALEEEKTAMPSGLMGQKALTAYLSRLSPSEAAKTQIIAVKIDRIDKIHNQVPIADYQSILNRVAAVLRETVCSDKMVVAYAGGGTFLIGDSGPEYGQSGTLESELNSLLSENPLVPDSGKTFQISISVGTPVKVRGTNEQRGGSALGRAIVLANARALAKQGATRSEVLLLVG